MTKIICAYSGVEVRVDHFPLYLDSRECYHPIFAISPKKLYQYYSHHIQNKLTQTESYLLFLALLNSTELIDWRVPAKRTEETASLVAQYLPDLYKAVVQISGIKHPSFSIPNIAITPDTHTLTNVKYWIKTWNEAYEDFITGLAKSDLKSKLARREAGLEKLIKSPQISPEKYAVTLAVWASEAGQFPDFEIPYEDGSIGTLSAYWQDIIVRCYKTENILAIPPRDLQELTEHCQEHIDAGSIFSHHLFAALEEGKSRQSNFFGIGDMIALSAENPGFRIIDVNNPKSVEDANLAVLIDTAPSHKPERKDFSSDFQYLKAKMKYELSLQYSSQKPVDRRTPE
jgi:hypothetical protein